MSKQIDNLENSINSELEELFNKEDSRLQSSLNDLHENAFTDKDEVSKIAQKTKTDLLVMQSYDVVESNLKDEQKIDISKAYILKTDRKFSSLKCIDFEWRKPSNVAASFTDTGVVSVSFDFFSDEEIKVLKSFSLSFKLVLKIWGEDEDEENEYNNRE